MEIFDFVLKAQVRLKPRLSEVLPVRIQWSLFSVLLLSIVSSGCCLCSSQSAPPSPILGRTDFTTQKDFLTQTVVKLKRVGFRIREIDTRLDIVGLQFRDGVLTIGVSTTLPEEILNVIRGSTTVADKQSLVDQSSARIAALKKDHDFLFDMIAKLKPQFRIRAFSFNPQIKALRFLDGELVIGSPILRSQDRYEQLRLEMGSLLNVVRLLENQGLSIRSFDFKIGDWATIYERSSGRLTLVMPSEQGLNTLSICRRSLESSSIDARLVAVSFLYRLDYPTNESTSLLIRALWDRDSRVRAWAAFALGRAVEKDRRGVTVRALATALSDRELLVRQSAAYSLVQLGSVAKLVTPQLRDAQKDKDVFVKKCVDYVLKSALKDKVKPAALPDFSTFFEVSSLFEEKNEQALKPECKPESSPLDLIVRLLIEGLDSSSSPIRLWCINSLGIFGNRAKQSIPSLIERLDDQDKKVRQASAQVLGKLGQWAIQPLTERLKDPNEHIRSLVILAFRNFKSDRTEIIPTLARNIMDSNKSVHKEKVAALKFIVSSLGNKSQEGIKSLILLLKDSEESVRRDAAFALGELGPQSSSAIPKLIDRFTDKFSVSDQCWRALKKIGSPAIDPLIKNLENKNPQIRKYCALTLGHIGSAAKKVVDVLKAKLARDPELLVRAWSAYSLKKIGYSDLKLIPDLDLLIEEFRKNQKVSAENKELVTSIKRFRQTMKSK